MDKGKIVEAKIQFCYSGVYQRYLSATGAKVCRRYFFLIRSIHLLSPFFIVIPFTLCSSLYSA